MHIRLYWRCTIGKCGGSDELASTLVWCSGLWDPFSFFIKTKIIWFIIFSKPDLLALAHFLQKLSSTAHRNPPPTHLYYIQGVLVHWTRANKSVEIVGPVYLQSVLKGWELSCTWLRDSVDIIDYNATKGGVGNMDKLVSAYSCKRRTLPWPLVIFFEILDISAYNAFCHLHGIEPRVEQREAPEDTPLSRGTWKDTGETTNPGKTACSENLSLCSHREEDSGGQYWCPIHPTYRTMNNFVSFVNLLNFVHSYLDL